MVPILLKSILEFYGFKIDEKKKESILINDKNQICNYKINNLNGCCYFKIEEPVNSKTYRGIIFEPIIEGIFDWFYFSLLFYLENGVSFLDIFISDDIIELLYLNKDNYFYQFLLSDIKRNVGISTDSKNINKLLLSINEYNKKFEGETKKKF